MFCVCRRSALSCSLEGFIPLTNDSDLRGPRSSATTARSAAASERHESGIYGGLEYCYSIKQIKPRSALGMEDKACTVLSRSSLRSSFASLSRPHARAAANSRAAAP